MRIPIGVLGTDRLDNSGEAGGPAMANKKNTGCSTCTRRRIRCDLAQPACKKCNKRGLECPGYGPRLRWAGGVAVRGRLKGRNVPIPGHDTGGAGGGGEAAGAEAETKPGPGPRPEDGGRAERPAAEAAVAADDDADGGRSLGRSPDLTLRKSARAFIEYYDRNIAGLMVWFDTEDNDYRRRVLPLAANTPGLRLAVAAISAHHGGMTFGQAVPRFSEEARDACLGLIQRRVRDMTGRLMTGGSAALTGEADIADAEWMLAAILIISTYEMANAQAAAAESHRMAARTIVNVFGHHDACAARVFDFLRNQMSILDILCSTTSFDLADVERAVLPPRSMADGLFTQFLEALHHVTLVSRRPGSSAPPDDSDDDDDDDDSDANWRSATAIRSRFEQATRATMLAAGRLQVPATAVGRDFVRLVNIYHDAAVLYAYRCLGHVAAEHNDRRAALARLFAQLAALEDATLCAQNLPWPAFVAGTECYGDAGRQAAIAALLDLMTRATGFRHFLDILRFLRMFWAGPLPDWRPLARDLQQRGFRILAV
ncbi:fungal specific transcription factor [Hirsutella rhossiliensis]|uniref:Fungal specific transcription factor domain-containing protein n=1 Tax=Hirsutella rhossiliensis TaxID=111463 RepID=A0A9P8MN15_9HYPO|nr:fungal specific transcription factor domain-containing protein [Hirsutella rhossiliensis]KAH0959218.1 fungal specific transcription factor domain-containing protein [Hirsutella rhossiliensis]